MEITWFGHSCFRLRDRDATVVTDPFDKTLGYELPRVRADIVTVSHDHPHHSHPSAVKGDFKVVNSPGEYEIKSVFITGIATYPSHRQGKGDEKSENQRNVIFVFEFNGLSFCHLGDLAQVPTQTQVEALSNIDVLMVPVGGGTSLNAAQAAEIISLIEPYIVIPMHYKIGGLSLPIDNLDAFLEKSVYKILKVGNEIDFDKTDIPKETEIWTFTL